MQQRNGRKCLTTVQGINPKVDLKKVATSSRAYTHTHTLAHTSTHTQTHTYILAHTVTHTSTRKSIRWHTLAHTRTCTLTRTHLHSRFHSHFLTHTRTHTQVIKAFKKEFACNGTVIENEEFGKVIQLQGDQRYANTHR